MFEECCPRNIHIVPLLAPTSTEESIKTAVAISSGFIYCVSLTGITGARDQVSQPGLELIRRVRRHTALPLALGFGISRREHVEMACQEAQAAAVGSALIRTMLESPRDQLVARAGKLVAELAGKSWPPAGGKSQ